MIDFENVLDRFAGRPAATDTAIAESEKQIGLKLPRDYVAFLKLANGGEGFIGRNAYAMLWSVEELAPMTKAYEAEKYAPGLLIFGSDGGGEAYGFDARNLPLRIVSVPFVGMAWDLAAPMGDSFSSFLQTLYEDSSE